LRFPPKLQSRFFFRSTFGSILSNPCHVGLWRVGVEKIDARDCHPHRKPLKDMMPDVQILRSTSFFSGYAAFPRRQRPGLLMIHEIFGLCESLRAQCDAFAARGYITLCPDLFWRTREKDRPEKESDWEEAARLYKNFDIEAGLRDLLASLAFLRQTPGCGGKVGAIGSCLGGRLAFF
jgi:carboxymethylenebutenolidase